MNTKELLEKRRMLKKKKPDFIRQDAHKKKKVGWKWRKPRGSDSKMRTGKKGYKRSVKVGWGSPSAVRGLSQEGLQSVLVSNAGDVQNIDPKTSILVILAGVGTKKRLEIVEKAMSKNIKIANYKDPAKFVEEVKKEFEKKKKEKEKLKEDREKKREAAKKEAQKKKEKEEKKAAEKEGKKEEKEEEMTEEEKKLEEKQEKDKLLISTQ
jgi:large subunit ribosomal protein L32e